MKLSVGEWRRSRLAVLLIESVLGAIGIASTEQSIFLVIDEDVMIEIGY
jgi:hypothetical protein